MEHVRVAVIGAGFGGLAMAAALRRNGIHDFALLERGDDVGGTWRDNTYPGCACDVPSHLYSFSFAPNPDWTRSFSAQPQIQAYLRRVASDLDLNRHVRTRHEVLEARWNETGRRWSIRTSAGWLSADVLVSAAGPLSDPQVPQLPGLDEFGGEVFHSARWRHDLDLTGRRVAVVGTGASAIQFVPEIAGRVAALHLFQRTPAWVLPKLDRPIPRFERALYRHVPGAQRLARLGVFSVREAAVPALVHRPGLMKAGELLARMHLRRSVKDPALRRRLTPDYAMGCKRILLSNSFYPALNRGNVEVIDSGLAGYTPSGVVSSDGRAREVDTVILGTGFQIGDLPISHRLVGRDGGRMSDVWRASGMGALRGSSIAGFPNLFFLVGPNTGVGHTSIIYMIESQVAYVMDALATMAERGLAVLEPAVTAQRRWNDALQRRTRGTVWTAGGCASWYLDRHGRNVTVWPGSVLSFRGSTRRLREREYESTPVPAPVPDLVGKAR